jgi:hypothetical protein
MGSMAAAFLLMLVVHSPQSAFSMTAKGSYPSKAACQAAVGTQPAPGPGAEHLCVSETDLEQLQKASR